MADGRNTAPGGVHPGSAPSAGQKPLMSPNACLGVCSPELSNSSWHDRLLSIANSATNDGHCGVGPHVLCHSACMNPTTVFAIHASANSGVPIPENALDVVMQPVPLVYAENPVASRRQSSLAPRWRHKRESALWHHRMEPARSSEAPRGKALPSLQKEFLAASPIAGGAGCLSGREQKQAHLVIWAHRSRFNVTQRRRARI